MASLKRDLEQLRLFREKLCEGVGSCRIRRESPAAGASPAWPPSSCARGHALPLPGGDSDESSGSGTRTEASGQDEKRMQAAELPAGKGKAGPGSTGPLPPHRRSEQSATYHPLQRARPEGVSDLCLPALNRPQGSEPGSAAAPPGGSHPARLRAQTPAFLFQVLSQPRLHLGVQQDAEGVPTEL